MRVRDDPEYLHTYLHNFDGASLCVSQDAGKMFMLWYYILIWRKYCDDAGMWLNLEACNECSCATPIELYTE